MKDTAKKVGQKVGVDLTAAIIVGLTLACGAAVAVLVPAAQKFLISQITLPYWLIILVGVLALYPVVTVARWYFRPHHETLYTRDWIDGMEWRWRYKGGKIADLEPHCIVDGCGVRLVLSTSTGLGGLPVTTIYCPACNGSFSIGGTADVPDLEARKIEQRIETRGWEEIMKHGRPRGQAPYKKPVQPLAVAGLMVGLPEATSPLTPPEPKPTPPKMPKPKPPSNPSGSAGLPRTRTAHEDGRPEPKAKEGSLDHVRLIETLKSTPPFHIAKVEAGFIGQRVEWVAKLETINHSNDRQSVQTTMGDFCHVFCYAADPNDITLMTANNGDLIVVTGIIEEASIHYIKLRECKFSFA